MESESWIYDYYSSRNVNNELCTSEIFKRLRNLNMSSHNTFLEMVNRYGVVVLLVFVTYATYLATNTLVYIFSKEDDINILISLLFSAIMYVFISGMTSAYINGAFYVANMVLWICVGCLASIREGRNVKQYNLYNMFSKIKDR